MNIKYIIPLISAAAALTAGAASPQVSDVEPYVFPNNRVNKPRDFTYTDDGTGYYLLSDDGKTIDRYDLRTGEKTETLFDVTRTRELTLPAIESFTLSDDGGKILVSTDREPIYRRSFKAKYYVYEVRSRLLTPLSKEFETQRAPLFSPDGRMVAFVADDNNIHISKLDYHSEVAVTTDGAINSIINGVPDWVYEEEFSTSCSMTWAPDNLTLCFLRYDESRVPSYSLPLYQGVCDPKNQYALYPGAYTYKYPVAGEVNSTVTVHSYDVETRKVIDIDLPDSKIEYIPGIRYADTPQRLIISTLNRDQNHFELYCCNPKSSVVKSIYSEDSNAWIDPATYEQLRLLPSGFVVQSCKSGYSQLYLYSYAGAPLRRLTQGDFDVTAFYGIDAKDCVYYQAARPTPMDRTIYRIDAKGRETAISKESGTTNATFSPTMTMAMFDFSDVNTPNIFTINTSEGKQVRVVEDNADYAARFASLPAKEFFTMESDGVTLNGYMIRPRNASRPAPVVMSQYSGPGSQSVLNRWSLDWEQAFALKGYGIVCVDGRGTGGRGRAFTDVVYKNLGHYETIDQINAARYAASLPWTDPDRIGIFGWSYGGYEALMAVSQNNSPYAAAVAVAPVTDWRYYDTVYAERYMLTPQQNEDGYRISAPLNRTAFVKCPILLMYGTADDNVHPANTLQYASTLQSRGTLFDMMSFPNMNHSIYGCNSRAVVYGNMLRFFDIHLKDAK